MQQSNHSEGKLIIDCPSGGSLMLPRISNINLRGTGNIEIINPREYNETRFDKITLDLLQPENNSVPMTLNMPFPTVIINEIQVFDEQILLITNKINQTIICNTLKLEKESFFDLPQLNVTNAEIGIGSVLNISNENATIKHFIIYYDKSQNDENIIPILFNSPFIELTNSDVEVIEYDTGNANIQDSSENYVIAQFKGMDESESKSACQQLTFISGSKFTKAECQKDGDWYNLVAQTKSKNKKKFPLAAIIGIAVGGVVLIVIIIVLVYVFACKKSKVSNSSSS